VLNKKKGDAPPQAPPPSAEAADPYVLLGVPRSATRAEIKAAYRAKARAMHPDVSPLPGAGAAFAAVAAAYAALTDDAARPGREGGAVDSWSEFKPTPKKQSARSMARGAPSARRAALGREGGDAADAPAGAETGDLVEYPLPEVVLRAEDGSRSFGVGLLVSRNFDRGDAHTLPPALLDICEVEPLRQRELGSVVWVPDDLGSPVFPRLAQLRVINRDAITYTAAHDRWTLTAPLSDGCAGPPHAEEVML
jgi:hypothetical protein